MAVLVEAISVVIRRGSIDPALDGGWVGFRLAFRMQRCALMVSW